MLEEGDMGFDRKGASSDTYASCQHPMDSSDSLDSFAESLEAPSFASISGDDSG